MYIIIRQYLSGIFHHFLPIGTYLPTYLPNLSIGSHGFEGPSVINRVWKELDSILEYSHRTLVHSSASKHISIQREKSDHALFLPCFTRQERMKRSELSA